ncbi:DNA polymerase II large subunit [Haloferax elongans ATCC BAA-1513]|uniref:DNA polymerase II large subunit n=1 Tax=Haloferax elongans ATCC BAA-1513 TaxID=1230453 RepID=M0HRI5_HALEO|nr:DNA polymerase II large subunit [Haloferax elongans]ELZ87195.1 DNA polymerase II large subunit [Haloferax elongans ATCC BAA-1513]
MREEEERYFGRIEGRLDEAFEVARAAKQQGHDPKQDVEIPVAKDMADRVENILGIDGVAERVRELEGEMSREEAALELVTDFVDGNVGDYDSREGKVEGAVRTAVALLTEGVVAAPIEGIDRVEILENDDGTEFVNVYYAGPIRSAGGTAQALSVLVADYARSLLGIDEYKGRDDEIERYVEEVNLYDKETGLQYSPKDKETRFIATNMPIMLDGEATGDEEVSGFRDLERVDTNSARGGMCLVMAEGIALKAPKIQRYTRQLDEVEWPWLQDLIDGTIGKDDGKNDESEAEADSESDDGDEDDADAAEDDDAHDEPEGPPRVDPATKFLRDLIAGRPVFGHPSAPGGFRLRYGRARNHGFATAGVHPATMHIVDDFIATGTQIKTERPGKAGGVVPVDSIEGPTVRLANGDVRRIDDPEEAEELQNGVEKIIDLGEYLVNFGEFVENNHPLAPASYVFEWWIQDFEATDANVQALRDDPTVSLEDPTVEEALAWADEYDAPLHPKFTYLWHDISVEQYDALTDAVAAGEIVAAEADGGQSRSSRAGGDRADGGDIAVEPEDGNEGTLVVENTPEIRETLENLLVEHRQTDEELRIPIWRPLARSLGLADDRERTWSLDDLSARAREWDDGDNAVEAVNELAPFEVRERAPTRIGGRMGRPEKSERRDLSPAVHTLFPIGEAGGSQRDVGDAARKFGDSGKRGEVSVRLGKRKCPDCGQFGFKPKCSNCGGHTKPHYECDDCGTVIQPDESGRVYCDRCEWDVESAEWQTIDLNTEYRDALESVGERESSFEILKGVKGLTSSNKTPEPIEKGILRAKHDVSSFKDGTVRYDMTDLPVTAVRPEELDVTADHFRELGYETDIDGEPLRFDDQLVELKVQDIVLSNGAAKHMMQTANFVDDLLEQFYGLEPFYKMDERDDLIGELVFGMAPHTSAAVVGRVIGFTTAAVGYAHPYFHAAKRRNCFHPETKVWYRDEADSWHYDDIRTFVEDRLDDPETDDFGTLVQELNGEVSVPSIGPHGNEVLQPVEAVSKHQSPDHMIRVETRSGREITVTPDHEMHVFEDGRLVSKRASEVSSEDYTVTPERLTTVAPSVDTPRFDLLEEFFAMDDFPIDRLTIRGLERDQLYDLFESKLADDWEGAFYPLQSTAEHLGLTKKGLSNYLYRESLPVSLLREFFDTDEELLSYVPDNVKLGLTRDRTSIDRYVTLDEDLATLLGYYAAEGFTRVQETPKGTVNQTTICGTELEARSFFVEVLENAFGVEPYRENEAKVTVSGRLLRTFFDTILDAGVLATEKRVPRVMFNAPDYIVEAYLNGYFSGDGCVSKNALKVSATTVSRELKEDVVALLKRLGITAQVNIHDPVPLCGKFPDHYEIGDESKSAQSYVVYVTSSDAVMFSQQIGFHLTRKDEKLRRQVDTITPAARRVFDGGDGDYLVESVASVEYVAADTDHTYCLTVAETHSLVANDLSQKQCDGDEDCVMLLMDGLLNFSKEFLPDKRGGQMDAPLVMSSRIDPSEIDDEAHNMDIVRQYPREFYEATRRMEDPDDWEDEVTIAEEYLGTDREYTGFDHTHDTTDIAAGPDLSAYKTLGSMMDKMDAQLFLARKLRAVDETDVAERVIEYHFLPDLIGNLRAFSRQETRCLDCGEKYRRMPLTGDCRECGGRVNLTVHQGSVNKYMDTAIQVAEEFDCRDYTKQRLEVLEKSLESIFENDKNKQSGIADFM